MSNSKLQSIGWQIKRALYMEYNSTESVNLYGGVQMQPTLTACHSFHRAKGFLRAKLNNLQIPALHM